MSDIIFSKERTFRQTDGVHFADITVKDSNGLDLVEHEGFAVSPPNNAIGMKRWYVHEHQTDNNRVVQGQRLFELYDPFFQHRHWYVFLTPETGALMIPPGCFHRSVSGNKGSILINHAIRSEGYDERKEFNPQTNVDAAFSKPCYYNITKCQADHFIRWGELPTVGI